MADENASPAVGAPAPTNAVPVAPSPAPVVEAVTSVDAAPAPEIAAEAPAEVAPAEPILETAAEPVVDPAVTADEAPKDPAVVEAGEATAPVYADFKMPEGFSVAPEQLTAFTGMLAKHNLTQEAGQELIDLHTSTLKTAIEQMGADMQQRQVDTFAETRKGWREDFFKTAGNRSDTIANDAKWAIHELVKDSKQRAELTDVLGFTGAGDNKAIINLLAAAARRLRERNAPAPGLPQNGARSGNPADRRYGKSAS